MDLGTVLKKVKSHVYKSKAEFKEDIDLIWENCLLYNTSPVSAVASFLPPLVFALQDLSAYL